MEEHNVLSFALPNFDAFGVKRFGSPTMKSDWCDLVSRILEATPAEE